jgi:hypothetical protein
VNGDTTWGMQIRGTGQLLPERRVGAEAPAMGGGGISLRYRSVAPLAFEVGLDALLGIDSNGYQRRELPVTFGMLLYLLPDTLVQPYTFFGVALTQADVQTSVPQAHLANRQSASYSYVGGHVGLGVDVRIAPELSLGFDAAAFIRERIDDDATRFPEFIDIRNGPSPNTTLAGQLRGGVTFWW